MWGESMGHLWAGRLPVPFSSFFTLFCSFQVLHILLMAIEKLNKESKDLAALTWWSQRAFSFKKKNIFWKKLKVEKIFFQTKICNSWTKCQWKNMLPCDTKIYVYIHHTTVYTHTYTRIHIHKLCKIMASSPIASWQIDGEKMETVTDFILGGSKISADGDCSHEIKRCWLLGRKPVTNLDSILKRRDITLPAKVHQKLWFFQ